MSEKKGDEKEREAKELEEHAWRREELRGLFALSLLASLFVIWTNLDKVLPEKELIIIGLNFYPLVLPAIYTIIFFWIIYAVFTILRFSDDIFESERLRQSFESIARMSFIVGPLMVSVAFFWSLSVLLIVYYFPASLYVLIGVLVLLALIAIYLVLRKKYHIRVVIQQRKP
jgi:hypothetical protein